MTLSQSRHLHICRWTTLWPSRTRNRRGRQSCGRHWLLPHLGQPTAGVRDTLGVVHYQPSESSRQASSEGFFLSLESSPTSAHDGPFLSTANMRAVRNPTTGELRLRAGQRTDVYE